MDFPVVLLHRRVKFVEITEVVHRIWYPTSSPRLNAHAPSTRCSQP